MARRAEGSARRIWWKTFGLLVLACGAWSLALPLSTGPDERDHAIRAAAVTRGEIIGEIPTDPPRRNLDSLELNATSLVTVPEVYDHAARASNCFLGEGRELLPSMASRTPREQCPKVTEDEADARTWTNQHRGQPFYYALVGLPSLLLPNTGGMYLMRLVAAAVCSALLASAVASVLQLANTRLAILSVWVTLTPVALYLAGTVNSAGLEIAAALGTWTAGLCLTRPGPTPVCRRLVARFGLAASVLAVARGLSPAFVVFILVVLAGLAAPQRRRHLLARTDVRLALGGVGLAAAVSGVWLLRVRLTRPLPPRPGVGLEEALGELGWWFRSTVAMFGDTDVVPPVALHFGWLAALLLVAGLAWALTGPRRVLASAAVFAAGGTLLVAGHGLSIPDIGYWWQGRYVLPILVGTIPIALSGAETGQLAERPARLVKRLGPPVMATIVALHGWAFLYATRHYTVGFFGPSNPAQFLLEPDWTSPFGPPVLWATVHVTCWGALAVVLWRAASRAEGDRASDRDAGGGAAESLRTSLAATST